MLKVDIKKVLEKAERSEVLDFMSEVIGFIREVKPLLEKITTNIEASVKSAPSASKKIKNVAEATELATTEILNIVDNIFPKLTAIGDAVDRLDALRIENLKKLYSALELIKANIDAGTDLKLIYKELDEAIEALKKNATKDKAAERAKIFLDELSSSATSIMMALQVQDITSQQLASVKHFLDSMYNRLNEILRSFESGFLADSGLSLDESDESGEKTNIVDMHREIAFDNRTVDNYQNKSELQSIADEIIAAKEKGLIDIDKEEGFSSSETDGAEEPKDSVSSELSNSDETAEKVEKASETANAEEPPTETETEEKEKKSPEIDIDGEEELDLDEDMSQDDIDKLFGG